MTSIVLELTSLLVRVRLNILIYLKTVGNFSCELAAYVLCYFFFQIAF